MKQQDWFELLVKIIIGPFYWVVRKVLRSDQRKSDGKKSDMIYEMILAVLSLVIALVCYGAITIGTIVYLVSR